MERAALYAALSAFALYGFCVLVPFLLGRLGFATRFIADVQQATAPVMVGVALLEFPIAIVAVAEPEDRTALSWVAFALSVAFWLCAMIGVVVTR
jgi:hypothetical protein